MEDGGGLPLEPPSNEPEKDLALAEKAVKDGSGPGSEEVSNVSQTPGSASEGEQDEPNIDKLAEDLIQSSELPSAGGSSDSIRTYVEQFCWSVAAVICSEHDISESQQTELRNEVIAARDSLLVLPREGDAELSGNVFSKIRTRIVAVTLPIIHDKLKETASLLTLPDSPDSDLQDFPFLYHERKGEEHWRSLVIQLRERKRLDGAVLHNLYKSYGAQIDKLIELLEILYDCEIQTPGTNDIGLGQLLEDEHPLFYGNLLAAFDLLLKAQQEEVKCWEK